MASKAKTTELKTDLISRIMAKLEGGDKALVTRFVHKLEKRLNSEIKSLKHNISKYEHDLEVVEETFEDKITDANDQLNDSITNVPIDKISTASLATEFVDEYLDNYESKLKNLDDIKSERDEEISKIKDNIDSEQKQIKLRLDLKSYLG